MSEEERLGVLVEEPEEGLPISEVDKKRELLHELSSAEVAVEPLPKTSALRKELEENLLTFNALADEMAELHEKVRIARENLVRLGRFSKNTTDMFRLAQLALNVHAYAEAKNRYEEIKDCASIDFGTPLASERLVVSAAEFGIMLCQIRLWNEALTAGESVDELDVETLVNKLLKTNRELYSAEEIAPLLDEAKGVWALALYRANLDEKPSLGVFVSFTEDLDKLDAIELPMSEKTLFRMESLRDLYRRLFNRLCDLYTTESRDFESALALFHHKTRIPAQFVLNPLYAESEDDDAFRVNFESRHLKEMDDEAYASSFPNVLVGIGTDLAHSLFASMLKEEDLAPGKLLATVSYFDTLNFERQTDLLAKLYQDNIPEERMRLMTSHYLSCKKIEGDLDVLAPNLLFLESVLQGEEGEAFARIKKALLRSPKSHRAIRKSSSVDAHALRGQKEGEYKPFVGKKLARPTVKAWSKTVHGLYIGGILTLGALSLAAGIGGFLSLQYLASPFLLTAPIAGLFLTAYWAIASYIGADERPARLFRILFGLAMFLLAGGCLAVYLFPVELAAYLPYAHPCFLASGVLGLAAFFLFLDKRQVWNYLIYLPLLLVWITALVFFILGLMQSQIIL